MSILYGRRYEKYIHARISFIFHVYTYVCVSMQTCSCIPMYTYVCVLVHVFHGISMYTCVYVCISMEIMASGSENMNNNVKT